MFLFTWLLNTQKKTYHHVEFCHNITVKQAYIKISANMCGQDTYSNKSPSGIWCPSDTFLPKI